MTGLSMNSNEVLLKEAWKYTPLFKLTEPYGQPSSFETQIPKPQGAAVVFENGFFNRELSQLPKGVELVQSSSLENQATLVARENLFRNRDNSQTTLCLRITQVLERPLSFYFLNQGEKHKFSPQISIEIKENIKLCLFEEFLSEGDIFINRTMDITLGRGSQVEHIVTATKEQESLLNSNTSVVVNQDSTYSNFLLTLNSKVIRHNLDIRLNEKGAHASSFGLYTLNDNQHADNYTFIHHAHEQTTSEQLFKGVLDDESTGIFTGKILVDKKSQQINSSQLNKTMLLSKKAHSHSQPQLEIFADDVKCSHGSTTGQLSPDEIFYFQSRGIGQRQAKEILSYAFIQDILMKISDRELREKLTTAFTQKFKKFQLETL